MAPKRAAAKSAPAAAVHKANTKAKVTKKAPTKKAPATKAATKTAAKKNAMNSKITQAEKAPAKGRGRPRKQPEPKPETKTKAAAVKPKTTKTKTNDTTTKKPAATKAAPKKAAPASKAAPKKTETKAPAKQGTKRKASDEASAPPAKKIKALVKGPILQEPPTERLLIFGNGAANSGELGLGTKINCIDVQRPRLNKQLDPETVGVVKIVAGGMHTVALTHDNKILTWGVGDNGALGRDKEWDGGYRNADADADDEKSDSGSDDDDAGLNPKEANPIAVDFSGVQIAEGSRWVDIAASDSASFAVTDDGKVYGWGLFRGNDGPLGFTPEVHQAMRPILIPDLKNIVSVKAGADHALALDTKGTVWTWGNGQQDQLARRTVDRHKLQALRPGKVGIARGKKGVVASIASGEYHSFALTTSGDTYSWGSNTNGETGQEEDAGQSDAKLIKPTIVESLRGVKIVSIDGGVHHTICATDKGDVLVFGNIYNGQGGQTKEWYDEHTEMILKKESTGEHAILLQPTKVPNINGKVIRVAAGTDACHAITEEGKAYAWGSNTTMQLGLGVNPDQVLSATLVDNTAVRDTKLNGCHVGGQFGYFTAKA